MALKIACAALALFLIFELLPAIVMTWYAFRRRDPADFDERPRALDAAPYARFKERILSDMACARSLPLETVHIKARDGVELSAEWLGLDKRRTVIFLHGYCSTPMNNFCSLLHYFRESGWNVLMPYQRGHGKSGGGATTLGLRERYDLVEWLKWAADKTGAAPVLLYGISMGGATVAAASELIQNGGVRAAVIDAGYDSPYEQFKHQCIIRHTPWRIVLPIVTLLGRLALGVDAHEDFSEKLKSNSIPTLFIYQKNDAAVPIECGRKFYEKCGGSKQWIELDNGGAHAMTFIAGGDAIKRQLSNFVEKQNWEED